MDTAHTNWHDSKIVRLVAPKESTRFETISRFFRRCCSLTSIAMIAIVTLLLEQPQVPHITHLGVYLSCEYMALPVGGTRHPTPPNLHPPIPQPKHRLTANASLPAVRPRIVFHCSVLLHTLNPYQSHYSFFTRVHHDRPTQILD